MSENFTKGEWWASDSSLSVCVDYDKGSCFSIADAVVSGGFISPEEGKANQRLIAAAPDLLKACKFALELIKLSEAFDLDLGKGWQNFKQLAEPAVKKAQRLK